MAVVASGDLVRWVGLVRRVVVENPWEVSWVLKERYKKRGKEVLELEMGL